MPYLSTLASFRDAVRLEARALKASNILAECDKLRDDVLPELGVRLEDKVTYLFFISINSGKQQSYTFFETFVP